MSKGPKWKKGDIVIGRVICEVIPCKDLSGKDSFRYGYRYDTEPENIQSLYCMESTLLRRVYYAGEK